MNVFVANVLTNSGDSYSYVFKNKPTKDIVVNLVWKYEGQQESIEWYSDTTFVNIREIEIIE